MSRVDYTPRVAQLDYNFGNPAAYHRFLRPGEFPELVYNRNAYDEEESWGCLHCWRRYGSKAFQVNYLTLPVVKRHIRDE